mmetsp:Transcript_23350/g.53834  ORF Transcript_23350/g.53834 Transcript_23350/m.53834 type:complete len:220 (+) Transcript_23350:267-926(+)
MATARAMKSATCAKSSSANPRVVIGCAPKRNPFGFIALLSLGMVFLLTTMDASSQTVSAFAPPTPFERKSVSTKWLSVPPDTRLKPLSTRASPIFFEFLRTCVWYSLNSGDCAIFKATAKAVIVWLWGPPWRPGKTAEFTFSSRSYMMGLPLLSTARCPFLKKIMAPRGPRNALCVVVVTMSAYSKGDGMTPADTRPEMCAMSASKYAPHDCAILCMRE